MPTPVPSIGRSQVTSLPSPSATAPFPLLPSVTAGVGTDVVSIEVTVDLERVEVGEADVREVTVT